jgi:DNA polymerase-3 subunit alpha
MRYSDETTGKLIDIALQLEGLYRHASTHAAGVVISGRPLEQLVPLYRDPNSDMPVTQFNMKYIEQAGLLKFDFLGLKTMTVVQKSLEYIKDAAGDDIDILRVPLDDAKTYKMMSEGKTTGVFQVESAGMRATLMSMKPNRFEDIIALVALYRPGPMDNIPRYIEIKEGKVDADYMHPKLQPYLEETYGIMVYQEQVMQAAQALAGYSLGGADLLRRAMGKKIQAEMDAQRSMFVEGAGVHSGVDPDRASEIFDTIDKFAGYGFNKSHAAAYALISYWTGWLKANYPVEFMAASMTLDMGNTDKLAVFKQELDKMGIPLLPPDINQSEVTFKVEKTPQGKAVRYALAALKGIGAQAMEGLIAERSAQGPYKSMADLASRIDAGLMNRRQFEQLASAGAFDCFNIKRAQAHGAAEVMLRHAQSLAQERASGQTSLFGGPATGVQALMPELPDIGEWDSFEKLSHEFDAVGFYLSAHPLDSKAAQLERMNIHNIASVNDMVSRQGSAIVDMAGVLLKKNIKVSQKSGNKFAFLQLSDATGIFEVMLFSEGLARARDYLEEGKTLLVKVMAESRDEQIRMTAQDVKPLEEVLTARMKEVHVHLSSEKPLATLQQLLNVEGRGRVVVRLFAPVKPGVLAEVTLPGQWNFSAAARNALGKVSGVEGIQEL